ncbi:hypothetical protein HYY74_03790 [Candidatus Woesearchaeota archaeon]|nr:hypothetical protein [Candidatus Woesearchaeota archaeon]
MKRRVEAGLLLAIFTAALALRLIIAYQAEPYTYEAYFNIRQIHNIKTELLPNFSDPLYYSAHTFMPLFHYLMAAALLALPEELAFKVLPNILASTTVILAFLISKQLTKDSRAALFSALSAGFIPVFITGTANSVSEYTLAVPLMLLALYLFLIIEKSAPLYIATLLALSLTHPISLVLVTGLAAYLILLYVLEATQSRAELETVFFSVILTTFTVFLFYKELLLQNGLAGLWEISPTQNVPSLNILGAIYGIGLLTFAAGLYMTYRTVTETKRKELHIPAGLALAIILLMTARLIPLNPGLMLLGTVFALIAGEAYSKMLDYLRKTHAARHTELIILGILLLFAFTSAIPPLLQKQQATPTPNELRAFEWLGGERDGTAFANLNEGHLIPAVANKRNFIDDRIPASYEPEQRIADMKTLYTTHSQITALGLLDEYAISYIVFTRRAAEERNITSLGYINKECFDLIFENRDAAIYRPLCRVS